MKKGKGRERPELLLLYDVGPRWCEYREALPSGGDHVVVRFAAPVTLQSTHWIAVVVSSPLVLTRVGTKGASWESFSSLQRVQCLLPTTPEVPRGLEMEFELAEPPPEER